MARIRDVHDGVRTCEPSREEDQGVPGAKRYDLVAILLCLTISVLYVWRDADAINHDAVSYITLASYWAQGRLDLAITGTWSPLIVWTLVPVVAVLKDPVLSARVVMAISALVFLGGGRAVLRAFAPASFVPIGTIVLAAFGGVCVGGLITPDLLSAGIFGFYSAALVRIAKAPEPRAAGAVLAGALLGLSYLAKAVLLPAGIVALFGMLACRIWLRLGTLRSALPAFCIGAAAALCVAGPWIGTLSWKYGQPTFSRAGIAAFVSIGPLDTNRDQPTNRVFVVPEPGRQSQFEDESILPQPSWSPFQSFEYGVHFVRHVVSNTGVTARIIRNTDFAGFAGVSLLFSIVLLLSRKGAAREKWVPASIIALAGMFPYLPIFSEKRYLFIIYPHLLAMALGAMAMTGEFMFGRKGRMPAALLVAAMFIISSIYQTQDEEARRDGHYLEVKYAQSLAAKLRAANLVGPIAAVGKEPDKLPAVFASYYLGTAYHGTQNALTVSDIMSARTPLLVARRHGPNDRAMALDRQFIDVDRKLFANAAEAETFPYRVYYNPAFARNLKAPPQ